MRTIGLHAFLALAAAGGGPAPARRRQEAMGQRAGQAAADAALLRARCWRAGASGQPRGEPQARGAGAEDARRHARVHHGPGEAGGACRGIGCCRPGRVGRQLRGSV
jgi:hypothetical protein